MSNENQNHEVNLFIPREIVNDKNLSSVAIAIYCILHSLSIATQFNQIYLSHRSLLCYLFGETGYSITNIKNIKDGLMELVNNKIIEIQYVTRNDFIIDGSKLFTNTKNGNFVKISCDSIRIVLDSGHINSCDILRYLLVLLGTIDPEIIVELNNEISKKNVVSKAPLSRLMELSGFAKSTILTYNKILEDLNLIYIARANVYSISQSGNVTTANNIYGRACDAEYIKKYALEAHQIRHEQAFKVFDIDEANKKRRLAQIYRQLVNNNDENYTKEEIIDVFRHVMCNNKRYYLKYEDTKDEKYLKRIRPTEIFKKYDFLKSEGDVNEWKTPTVWKF